MIAQPEPKTYSPEAYLELETASEERHEYINGEIRPMAGGTPNHNELASILNGLLRLSLRGQPYIVIPNKNHQAESGSILLPSSDRDGRITENNWNNYSIFVADQRLWIPEFNIYTYPDVMVIQRPVMLQQGRNDTVTNPLMIAEILFQSTRSYDKDEKFTAYRSLPTFQEYLLIDQYQLKVERYSKFNQKQWLFSEYTEATDKIVLSSLPFEIQLGDLYSDLDL